MRLIWNDVVFRSRVKRPDSYDGGNLRIHFVVAVAVIVLAVIVSVTRIELIALLISITFVLIAEMINSAVEGAIAQRTHDALDACSLLLLRLTPAAESAGSNGQSILLRAVDQAAPEPRGAHSL